MVVEGQPTCSCSQHHVRCSSLHWSTGTKPPAQFHGSAVVEAAGDVEGQPTCRLAQHHVCCSSLHCDTGMKPASQFHASGVVETPGAGGAAEVSIAMTTPPAPAPAPAATVTLWVTTRVVRFVTVTFLVTVFVFVDEVSEDATRVASSDVLMVLLPVRS